MRFPIKGGATQNLSCGHLMPLLYLLGLHKEIESETIAGCARIWLIHPEGFFGEVSGVERLTVILSHFEYKNIVLDFLCDLGHTTLHSTINMSEK